VRSTSATYIPRLDQLRFFAVALVLSWHAIHVNGVIPFAFVPAAFPLSIFEEGHTGVSLFLTLSGFIFARLCYGRSLNYGAFIRNRLLRVAPLLIIWTIVNFELSQLPAERLLAMLVMLTSRGDFPGLGWTVLIEIQLYFVFPFLLRFSRWYGQKYLVGVVLVALLLRSLIWLTVGSVQFLAYWTVLGRADQFVLGMLGFEASRRWPKLFGNPFVLLVLSTAWLLICHRLNVIGGYYDSSPQATWIYLPSLEGLFYAAIAAAFLNVQLPAIPLVGRFIAWLGTLSYSAYLNHFMIVQACFLWATRFGFALSSGLQVVAFTVCVIAPLVFACSALTYYVIELPFLRLRTPYLIDDEPAA
jgi:peptidoglycan/LPS O-acetylase OafA/YrhL